MHLSGIFRRGYIQVRKLASGRYLCCHLCRKRIAETDRNRPEGTTQNGPSAFAGEAVNPLCYAYTGGFKCTLQCRSAREQQWNRVDWPPLPTLTYPLNNGQNRDTRPPKFGTNAYNNVQLSLGTKNRKAHPTVQNTQDMVNWRARARSIHSVGSHRGRNQPNHQLLARM